MRLLQIKISEKQDLRFKIPGMGAELSTLQKLVEIADYLFTGLFLTFLFFLPLSGRFFGQINVESSTFVFGIIMLLITLSVYLFAVIFGGKSRLIDPEGLFWILFFALISTAAAIAIQPPESTNTFGSIGENAVKAFSGVAIVVYLFFFYFVSLNTKTIEKIRLCADTFLFGLAISSFVELFDWESFNPVMIIVGLASLIYFFLSSRKILIKYLSLVLSIVLFASLLIFKDVSQSYYFIFLLSGAISSIVVVVLFMLNNSEKVSKMFEEISKSFTSVIESPKNLFSLLFSSIKILIVYSFFIFATAAFILGVTNTQNLEVFSEAFDNVSRRAESLADDGIGNLLIGDGSGEITQRTNYSNEYYAPQAGNKSTIDMVLRGQGLLGITALGILVASGFFYFVKNLKMKMPYTVQVLNYFLFGVYFFINLISLFIYPGILIVLFQIFLITLMMAIYAKHSNRYIVKSLKSPVEIKFLSKYLGSSQKYLYLLFFILFISIGIILSYLVIDQIDQLF